MSDVHLLRQIVDGKEIIPAPGAREFVHYDSEGMLVRDGRSYCEFIVGIGKDHVATITMHKDALAALLSE